MWLCLLAIESSLLTLLSPAVAFVPIFVRTSSPFNANHSPYDDTTRILTKSSQRMISPSADEKITNVLTFVDELLYNESERFNLGRDTILSSVDHRIAWDCAASRNLPVEDDTIISPATGHKNSKYDWIHASGHQLAIRSLEPILNATEIATIRQAAEAQWQNLSETSQKSRFTYQRPGNYEAHVSDLGPQIKTIMKGALLSSIYPMIRQAFWNEPSSRLCVYDALIIRYNATEAQQASFSGAGQPLHRDLGLVSFNIMLNTADDFDGGGTFFENQLLADSTTSTPLKPKNAGHCLAHFSSERHAGASTSQGVRDIMVIFVMAEMDTPPALMRNALLKQSQDACNSDDAVESVLCRITRQSLAVKTVPKDGEAFQYLGKALMDYAQIVSTTSDSISASSFLEAAVYCLQHASTLTPCDARIYNNLGLALGRMPQYSNTSVLDDESITNAYEHGYSLLERSRQAGCDVQNDFDAIRLNYGLYRSNQDRFGEAADILRDLAARKRDDSTYRLVDDAHRLWNFCEKRR